MNSTDEEDVLVINPDTDWNSDYLSSIIEMERFYFTKTSVIKDYNYDQKGSILLVGSACRQYFATFYASHINSYNQKHIKLNKKFIRLLNKSVFQRLIYRFHWQFGFNELDKINNEFPDLKLSTREDQTYFYDLLYNSSLAICTTNMTTMLQTFVLNHPTILLWDPKYQGIRKSSSDYYNQLHDAGILYYSPELCAKKINEIASNPMDWWMTDNVQSAKNNFRDNFCRQSDNLGKELANIIYEMR